MPAKIQTFSNAAEMDPQRLGLYFLHRSRGESPASGSVSFFMAETRDRLRQAEDVAVAAAAREDIAERNGIADLAEKPRCLHLPAEHCGTLSLCVVERTLDDIGHILLASPRTLKAQAVHATQQMLISEKSWSSFYQKAQDIGLTEQYPKQFAALEIFLGAPAAKREQENQHNATTAGGSVAFATAIEGVFLSQHRKFLTDLLVNGLVPRDLIDPAIVLQDMLTTTRPAGNYPPVDGFILPDGAIVLSPEAIQAKRGLFTEFSSAQDLALHIAEARLRMGGDGAATSASVKFLKDYGRALTAKAQDLQTALKTVQEKKDRINGIALRTGNRNGF